MLVFDIGKTAFSICPEVENGYIKSIIAVNDEIWVGTNGSGIRISVRLQEKSCRL